MPSRPAQPRPAADHLRLVTPAQSQGTAPAAVSLRPKGVRSAAGPAKGARSFGDWTLHGLGVGAATASAGFATYALVFSSGQVVPSGNFSIFARYDHLYRAPTIHRDSSPDTETASAPEAAPPARDTVAKADGVDFTPTGSLSAAADGARGEALPGRTGRSTAEARALPDFNLRDVFDGKALVESRSSLSVVRPGSVLDGAGQVLSIEKRGDRWVVLTQNGVIAAQRR